MESRALLDSLVRKLYCDGSGDDNRTLLAYAAHSSKLFPAPARQNERQRHHLKRMPRTGIEQGRKMAQNELPETRVPYVVVPNFR